MDPITAALVGIGAVVFAAMIFFLIDNITTVIKEIEESMKRTLEAEARAKRALEEYEKRIEVQAERLRDEDKIRRLNSIKSELEDLKNQYGRENSIAESIDSILSGGPATIVLNIVRLIDLIRKSFFLSKNLKNPKNSIIDIERKIERLERKLELILDE